MLLWSHSLTNTVLIQNLKFSSSPIQPCFIQNIWLRKTRSISYLLLHNKLSPNIGICNNNCYFFKILWVSHLSYIPQFGLPLFSWVNSQLISNGLSHVSDWLLVGTLIYIFHHPIDWLRLIYRVMVTGIYNKREQTPKAQNALNVFYTWPKQVN
jgi:hypothetical protein